MGILNEFIEVIFFADCFIAGVYSPFEVRHIEIEPARTFYFFIEEERVFDIVRVSRIFEGERAIFTIKSLIAFFGIDDPWICSWLRRIAFATTDDYKAAEEK